MTIEFLESADPDDRRDDERPEDRRARRVRAGDAVLSLGGAALLVVACYRQIYSIRVGSGTDLTNFGVDGWGRLSDLDGLEIGQHAPRLGIVLCVAAGLAVLGLAIRWWRPGRHRVGSALATVAAGAALAMAGDGILTGLATYDSYHRAVLDDESGDRVTLEPSLDFGGFVWLGLAGAACILLAVVLRAIVRPGSGDPEPIEAESISEPVSEHDEQLG